jgi:two-component system LytT family response regulator
MKTRLLISDDELSGRVTIELLLKKLMGSSPFILDIASSLPETVSFLSQHQYDLIFLDINFKGSSSFEIIDQIPASTKIVFVTAYSEHAIRAIRSNAFDYLLKPVKEEELKECLGRFYSYKEVPSSPDMIQVKEKGLTRIFKLNEIVHLKGKGPYSVIFTRTEQITTVRTLKSLIPDLGSDFIRIHKSYLVNRNFIQGFQKNKLFLTNNVCLPVSRNGLKNLST